MSAPRPIRIVRREVTGGDVVGRSDEAERAVMASPRDIQSTSDTTAPGVADDLPETPKLH